MIRAVSCTAFQLRSRNAKLASCVLTSATCASSSLNQCRVTLRCRWCQWDGHNGSDGSNPSSTCIAMTKCCMRSEPMHMGSRMTDACADAEVQSIIARSSRWMARRLPAQVSKTCENERSRVVVVQGLCNLTLSQHARRVVNYSRVA